MIHLVTTARRLGAHLIDSIFPGKLYEVFHRHLLKPNRYGLFQSLSVRIGPLVVILFLRIQGFDKRGVRPSLATMPLSGAGRVASRTEAPGAGWL